MKQLIYSTGIFETELKVWPPEEIDDYDHRLWRTTRRSPRFQVRKTSRCLMRFEIEDGDIEYLHKLRVEMEKCQQALQDGGGTRNNYKRALDIWTAACNIYDKALAKYEGGCEGVFYIEIADETERGCQALYRIDDGLTRKDERCKIGEPLVIKAW